MYLTQTQKNLGKLILGGSFFFLLARPVWAEACVEAKIQGYIAQFKDKNELVQEAALNKVIGCSEYSIEALSKVLEQDRDPTVRAKAVEALGKIGESVPEFIKDRIPLLSKILKQNDESPQVRAQAGSALFKIVQKAYDKGAFKESDRNNIKQLTEILIATLNQSALDPDPRVRVEAVVTLEQIATLDKDQQLMTRIFPKLVEVISSDPDPMVRLEAAEALGSIGNLSKNKNWAKKAVPHLVELFKTDEFPRVRLNPAYALGNIAEFNEEVIDTQTIDLLIEHLQEEKEPSPGVRRNAAYALGYIGDKRAVSYLLDAIKTDSNERVQWETISALGIMVKEVCPTDSKQTSCNDLVQKIVPDLTKLLDQEQTNFQGKISQNVVNALGNVGGDAKAAVTLLVKLLKTSQDTELRKESTEALGKIASNLASHNGTSLSEQELEPLKKQFEEAQEIIKKPENKEISDRQSLEDIENYLKSLGREQLFNQLKPFLKTGIMVLLSHTILWLALIFLYPRYRWIQTHFFWEPTIRKWFGFGYVSWLLTGVPWLRSIMLAPFKDILVLDADLANFKPEAYFADSQVRLKGTLKFQPMQQAITEIRGQTILEGESGLGKSMFLKHLIRSSRRLVAYLPAKKCDCGVIEAIQAKLHGYVAEDSHFLKSLIYSGAMDICIDGLNEVTPGTRARITDFVESYPTGNIILATQPLEWTPPCTCTANIYVLQPLKPEQIEEFLISRQKILPPQVPISGKAYERACQDYLANTLNPQKSEEELEALRRLLSNPMDLTLVVEMLACGKQPDLLNLQQQQYELMAADYQQTHLKEFPLEAFAEATYQMRLNNKAAIPAQQLWEELQCMERYKMVLCRQWNDPQGKLAQEWHFRHDKIQDFFIMQTFLGEDNERPGKHLDASRFRGVYLMLAAFLPFEAGMHLREKLIQNAVKTKDHTISDKFIQILASRKAA